MLDISEKQYAQISCRNSAAMILYVLETKSEFALQQLFEGILESETLISKKYQYLGKPLTLAYFQDENNWYSNDINLTIFDNLSALNIDAFDTGHFVIKNAIESKNSASLAYLKMLGPVNTIKKINQLNSVYNRTKIVDVVESTSHSAVLKLSYNCAHNDQVTRQNLGVYFGSLESLGMTNIKFNVQQDDFSPDGITQIKFFWRSEPMLFKLKLWLGRFIATRCCTTYLKSEQVIQEFHANIKQSFDNEIAQKEQQKQQTERYYHALLKEKEQKEQDLNLLVAQRTQELAKSVKDKELLFESFSHELKTPLTLIIGPLERLLKQPLPPELMAQLQGVENNAKRLYELVKTLLDFAELKVNYHQQATVNIQECTLFIIESLRPLASAKQSTITLNYQVKSNLTLKLRAQTWELILTNLLTNAINHGDIDNKINVSISQLDSVIQLQVTDNNNKKIAHTNTSDRSHLTKEQELNHTSGHGLGLAIVKELVNVHKGEFTFTETDCGNLVTVSLPNETVCSLTVKPINVSDPIDTLICKSKTNTKPSVLLVEDNLELADFLISSFTSEFNLIYKQNGQEALDYLADHSADLIVSDVMMPKLNGFEFCQRVKSSDTLKHIPLILLTAKADLASQKIGLSVQADDYIGKPFNVELLSQKIKNIIATYQANAQKLQKSLTSPTNAEQKSINHQHLSKQENTFMQQVQKSLAKHFEDPDVKAKHIAADFCMSERNLNRKLNIATGKSLMDLLKSYRLNQAKQRLLEGQSVKAVSFDTGFNSQSYFIKCFKQEFGQTPSQAQKQQLENA